MNLKERFEKYEDEFLKFDLIESKRSPRHDIHAFLLLNELCPGSGSIVSGAEHDEIWLDTDPEELNRVATDDQILELVRCGIRWCSDSDCLGMFV